jgi:hypothetical protein
MDLHQFLESQAEGVAMRRRELEAIRAAMVEGETPVDCIDHVIAQLAAIFNEHTSTVSLHGLSTAAEGAEVVQAMYLPVVRELEQALAVALVRVWQFERGIDT